MHARLVVATSVACLAAGGCLESPLLDHAPSETADVAPAPTPPTGCGTGADCGGDRPSCLCGVCSSACESDLDCAIPGDVCADGYDACICPARQQMCLPSCRVDSDCAPHGPALFCFHDLCMPSGEGGGRGINVVVQALQGFVDIAIAHPYRREFDDTEWRITVAEDDGDVVFEHTGLTSQYGAPGRLTYVGPCDAQSDYNTVTVRLVGAFRNGKPVGERLPVLWDQQRIVCEENVDLLVDFDFRPGPRGEDPMAP